MGRVDEFLDEVALAPAYTLDALNDTFRHLADGGLQRPGARGS
jgi:hypothetical protein